MPAALRHLPTAMPAVAPVAAGGGWNSITVPGGAGGQFVVAGMVNWAEVTFLIDSGASEIVLSLEDARRAGHRPFQLRFSRTAATANGMVRLAPVTLRELRIGQLSRRGLDAVVNEAPMPVSLLGMSFLRRLEGWEAKGGRLMLYW
jgi:aspartyl protease family protein